MIKKKVLKKLYRSLPLKPQLFTALRNMVSVPQVIYQHLHFEGPFKIDVDDSHSFTMNHYGSSEENDLFWRGFSDGYEATSLRIWCRLVPMASVVIDTGANTGLYSLSARCLNPGASIVAFEPVKRVYERLVANIRLNEFDITAEPLALSDASGCATFYDLPDEHPVSASLDAAVAALRPDAVPVPITTVRLDQYLKERSLPPPDIIKVDVERHEPAVLRGMGAILADARPTFILEILTDDVARQVSDVLDGNDYLYFIIEEGRGVSATSSLLPRAKAGQNFLICQERVADAINIHELAFEGDVRMPRR